MKIELSMSEREARALATWLDEGGSLDDDLALVVAHQIENQLPKQRIPDPGKWGVVAARTAASNTSYHFVNWGGIWATSEGYAYSWDSLIDPVLIREGI